MMKDTSSARGISAWSEAASLCRRAICVVVASIAGLVSALEWTQVVDPSANAIYRAVAHTPLGWFAVGEDSRIVHSTDGVVWRWVLGASFLAHDQMGLPKSLRTDTTIPPGMRLNSLAWKDGVLVVVGDSGIVLTTRDGVRWSVSKVDDTTILNDVASDGKRFVVVGSSGAILRSDDGLAWERRPGLVTEELAEIVHFGGMFYARGYDGSLIHSKDGGDWGVRNTDSLKFLALAANHVGVLATAARKYDPLSTFHVLKASGDTAWTDMGQPAVPDMMSDGGIVADDSSWFVVNGWAWRTRDGSVWAPDSFASPDLRPLWKKQAAWFDGTWISLRAKPPSTGMVRYALASSRDFKQWKPVHSGTQEHAVVVEGADDGWWLVQAEGNHSASPTTLRHSRDLVHWDDSWIGFGFPIHLDTCSGRRVLWGSYLRGELDRSTRAPFKQPSRAPTLPYQNFGCGDGERLSLAWKAFSSTVSATLWKPAGDSVIDTISLGSQLRGVRRFKGRWVVVGVDKGDTSWSATSIDGRTWTGEQRLFSNSVEDLATDGFILVGVGDTGTVMTSIDGSTWERSSVGGTTDWWRISFTGGWFVATGAGGRIALSRDGRNWMLDSLPARNRMAISAAVRADTLVVGTEGGSLYFATGLVVVASTPRRNPTPRFVRAGTKVWIAIDPNHSGPWYLMDLAGRRRAVGRLREGEGRVEFDLRDCGRGILVPSWAAGAVVVHP